MDLLKMAAQVMGGGSGASAVDLFKVVGTHATAALAKGPISEVFQRMHVEGRQKLAQQLRKAADCLESGRCDDAASVAADVIDDIKF